MSSNQMLWDSSRVNFSRFYQLPADQLYPSHSSSPSLPHHPSFPSQPYQPSQPFIPSQSSHPSRPLDAVIIEAKKPRQGKAVRFPSSPGDNTQCLGYSMLGCV